MKLLIFTYAPAGLGHLRVTDALVSQRPKEAPYVILGSIDRFITSVHRFMSINPFGKYIFVRSQYGLFEDIFTFFYTSFLRHTASRVYRELLEILEHNPEADEVFVIATHFGLAHQIGAVKEKLSKKTGKKIRLVVQVTDDTSQHIWCVKGADLTFVPSERVKNSLYRQAKKKGIDFVAEVIPYPIDSLLTAKLEKGLKRESVYDSKQEKINVAIPVSGAAVGLNYFTRLIRAVNRISDRFKFFVVVKRSPFTEMFIQVIARMPNVHMMIGQNDIQTVELYELMYVNNLIHLEVTKPSEQAFKAILPPTAVGGSILLFTAPVGRQEKENIEFLNRHGLLPVTEGGCTPRAVKISSNPQVAADFMVWGVYSGQFKRMSAAEFKFCTESVESKEVGCCGAKMFWEILEKRFGAW